MQVDPPSVTPINCVVESVTERVSLSNKPEDRRSSLLPSVSPRESPLDVQDIAYQGAFSTRSPETDE